MPEADCFDAVVNQAQAHTRQRACIVEQAADRQLALIWCVSQKSKCFGAMSAHFRWCICARLPGKQINLSSPNYREKLPQPKQSLLGRV